MYRLGHIVILFVGLFQHWVAKKYFLMQVDFLIGFTKTPVTIMKLRRAQQLKNMTENYSQLEQTSKSSIYANGRPVSSTLLSRFSGRAILEITVLVCVTHSCRFATSVRPRNTASKG
jgi:hypothetical protein